MIKLTSTLQANKLKGVIPDIVIKRMKQFQGNDGLYDPDIHGYIIWLQENDDIANIPDIAEHGLLTILEECDQPCDVDDYQPYCFEHVESHQQQAHNIYEMIITIDADKAIVLFTYDAPWLDIRLKQALERQIHNEQGESL